MKYIEIIRKFDLKLSVIILLAAVLRFYNYQDRWALAYDQAWFALVARHALNTFQIPLLGPFASGGPFQTGGEWFWVVMAGTLWTPTLVIAPWIFITFLSVVQVYLMYLLGKEILNKNFGLLVSLLTAVSTSQTLQATNLTNQTTISLWSTLLIWSIIKYLKDHKLKYLLLAGFAVGFASSLHFQGVLLLPVIIIFIIFGKVFSVKKMFLVFLGILIPWLPVLYVDAQNNFYNTLSILSYFSSNQSQASYDVLGRRWLTFITQYIPLAWARIIGGISVIGYIEIFLLSFFALINLRIRKITTEWYVIAASVFTITILLRYIRAPLFENYITFLHPFIFLLTGWMILQIFRVKKIAAGILTLTICVLSIYETVSEVKGSTNMASGEAKKIAKVLKDRYPNEKLAIYDYDYLNAGHSVPVVLYLETDGKIDDGGRKIGYSVKNDQTIKALSMHPVIYGKDGEVQLFDLNSSKSSELTKNKWKSITTKSIYDSVQNWFRIKR